MSSETFTRYKIGWRKRLTLCKKNYKHVLIQEVTFSTKKNSWHSLTQENHVSTHKTYVYTNQTMLYLHTHFLEYTETFLCPHSVFHLQQPSLDWMYVLFSKTVGHKITMNSKWFLYTISSSLSKNSVFLQAVTPTNIAE